VLCGSDIFSPFTEDTLNDDLGQAKSHARRININKEKFTKDAWFT
jgi:hypothetical protein